MLMLYCLQRSFKAPFTVKLILLIELVAPKWPVAQTVAPKRPVAQTAMPKWGCPKVMYVPKQTGSEL